MNMTVLNDREIEDRIGKGTDMMMPRRYANIAR